MLFRIIGTPVYILGSHHFLPESWYVWPPAWLEAWESSEQLVVETRSDTPLIISDGEYIGEESLRQKMTEASYAKVQKIWELLGLDVPTLGRVKP